MIHNYTSNISRKQFELIREDLENARKRTRPRTVDLYEAFCGVLYLLTTGCQVISQIGKPCIPTIKFSGK
ncbi:transposase [Bacillus cereus]|uniref:transposase n=1 Tax=Bacillus thuringiensis TaxID=1428 RepID=UPI0018CD812D|nr:transposase [Bacillus thuringiensis]MEB9338349.1 transposase [Bacillus cereus]